MTDRAHCLFMAIMFACLIGCWHRLAEVSNRLEMAIMVQRSQDNDIAAVRNMVEGLR